jgi:hypothetical protein
VKWIAEQFALTFTPKMQITKTGIYELTADLPIRGTISCGILPKFTLLHVTQIDADNHKFYCDEIGDWHYYAVPCKIWEIPHRPETMKFSP